MHYKNDLASAYLILLCIILLCSLYERNHFKVNQENNTNFGFYAFVLDIFTSQPKAAKWSRRILPDDLLNNSEKEVPRIRLACHFLRAVSVFASECVYAQECILKHSSKQYLQTHFQHNFSAFATILFA